MKYLIVILITVLFCNGITADVADSKHNLSAFGSGSIKVAGEQQVCVFCHTRRTMMPAKARWNRFDQGTTYIPYESSTLIASPGQPTGSSLLCLGCHDGTIALRKLLSNPDRRAGFRIAMRGMAHRKANLSTDLSDDHPISLYYYDSYSGNSAEYKHPDALSDDVTLDASGQIQCVSCHDPHDDDFGMFLRLDNSNGQLCQQCHLKTGWDESVHGLEGPQTSAKRNTGKQKTGCAACHATHSAGGRQRLLYYAEEENNCFYCHNGRGKNITSDLENEFQKPSRHPMWETGKHDPLELTVMEERHVECVDCHNPHAARKDTVKVDRNGELEVGKQLPGSLLMLRGVTSGGSVIEAVPGINREYQLCFRCHGDSMNQPSPLVTRWRNEFNIRKEFEPSNISFHPVVQQGKNDNVPSLLSPLTTNTIINCTDCHNNNDLNGIAGPHGSIYAGLLEREYITEDLTIESESAYALCYKCHDRTSILDNESFSLHEMHIRGAGDNMSMDEMGTSCSTCHDPHGSVQQRLINFDATVVLPSGSGLEEFNVNGPQAGSCSLTCHNKDHDPLCYDEDGATDC